MSDNRELIARLRNPTLREFNPEAAAALTEQAAVIAAAQSQFKCDTYGAFWKSRAQAMYAALTEEGAQ